MVAVSSKQSNARARPSAPKAKQPAIGWVLISRAEVAKAEALLNDRQRGVVDELGLLSIHQAFADRLFPGTSVLHTRLRYALFVPWLMQTAARSANPVKKLEQLEFELTDRLKLGLTNKAASEDDTGIIGSRVYEKGKPAAQPASFSYWSALATWGVLGRNHRHSAPSRESVLEELGAERKAGSAVDLDGQSLSTGPTYFQDLPLQPPALLEDPKGVTFRLAAHERQYLRNRLRSTKAPTLEDETPRKSFLAALARNTVRPLEKTELWDDAAVTNETSATVGSYSIDPATGSLSFLGQLATGGLPEGVDTDPVSGAVYVAQQSSKALAAHTPNPQTGNLTAQRNVPVGGPPIGIAVLGFR